MSKTVNCTAQRRGRRLLALAHLAPALALAAGLLAAISEPVPAATAAADPLVTASVAPAPAAHELRIERTRGGGEGLSLAARLHDSGGHVIQPIRWTVRRAISGRAASGEPVYRGETPKTELRLPPGEYRVDASYGFSHLAHELAIEPGQRVGLTLILNVGGIRPLSRLEAQDLPSSISASHALYALSGHLAGQRLTATAEQGAVLRVGAGHYRVESRFEPGNAVTDSMVTVKAGVLSSIEIAHLAGLVRVEIAGATANDRWTVRDRDSGWSWQASGPGGDLVLAPGRYEAVTVRAGHTFRVDFAIAAGQSLVVLLGR